MSSLKSGLQKLRIVDINGLYRSVQIQYDYRVHINFFRLYRIILLM